MADPVLMIKRFGACVAILVIALLVATAVHADDIPRPEWRVAHVECVKGAGMVTGLTLLVAGPGVVELHWDNRGTCGQAS